MDITELAGCVIVNDNREVLLMRRREVQLGRGVVQPARWEVPGGALSDHSIDPTPVFAAVKRKLDVVVLAAYDVGVWLDFWQLEPADPAILDAGLVQRRYTYRYYAASIAGTPTLQDEVTYDRVEWIPWGGKSRNSGAMCPLSPVAQNLFVDVEEAPRPF